MNYRRAFIKNSKIFITVVVNKRRKLLIDKIELLRQAFKETKSKIPFEIEAIVILPNHIHMIIEPKEEKEYPNIIKSIKSYFSRQIDETEIEDYELTQSRKEKKVCRLG